MNYLNVLYKVPYVKKLENWTIKIDLQVTKNFIRFESKRAYCFGMLEKINQMNAGVKTDRLKIGYFIELIKLIYNLSKNEYGFFKRRKYKKYLMDTFLDNVSLLIDIYREILDHNSYVSIKKKLQEMRNYDIWAVHVSQTIGDDYYSKCIRRTEDGRKYLIPASSLN
jgi:hypothetical protein